MTDYVKYFSNGLLEIFQQDQKQEGPAPTIESQQEGIQKQGKKRFSDLTEDQQNAVVETVNKETFRFYPGELREYMAKAMPLNDLLSLFERADGDGQMNLMIIRPGIINELNSLGQDDLKNIPAEVVRQLMKRTCPLCRLFLQRFSQLTGEQQKAVADMISEINLNLANPGDYLANEDKEGMPLNDVLSLFERENGDGQINLLEMRPGLADGLAILGTDTLWRISTAAMEQLIKRSRFRCFMSERTSQLTGEQQEALAEMSNPNQGLDLEMVRDYLANRMSLEDVLSLFERASEYGQGNLIRMRPGLAEELATLGQDALERRPHGGISSSQSAPSQRRVPTVRLLIPRPLPPLAERTLTPDVAGQGLVAPHLLAPLPRQSAQGSETVRLLPPRPSLPVRGGQPDDSIKKE